MKKRVSAARAPRAPAPVRSLTAVALAVLLCFSVNGRGAARPEHRVVVVDAGHGGIDGGTSRGTLLEKDITLKAAQKLKALLEREGCTVVMTRNADVSLDGKNRSSRSRHTRDLNARTGIINGSGADLFISIHVNSLEGDPSENGSIVFYGSKFPQSEILAQEIQKELNGIAADCGRKRQKALSAGFFLLRYTEIPGVIVETGFITNKKDRELLMSDAFLNRLAEAVAAGTARYLRGK